jgi:hypothetical protein
MIRMATQVTEPAVIGSQPISYQAALVDRVEKTRREYRRFLVARTAVWAAAAILIVGGLTALADYHWVLSQTARQSVWAVLGSLVAILAIRRAVINHRAAFNRLDAAAEIETAFPQLGQRVCTTLEYAEPTPTTMPAWPSLVQALTTDTAERTYRLDFHQVIPWRRLRWPTVAAIALLAFFVLLIAVSPSARTALMRLFLLPVHYTQLQVEPGNHSVKFGADVNIRAILSGRPVTKAELLSRKAGSDDSWAPVSLAPGDSQDTLLSGTLETSLKKCQDDLEYRVTADAVESETYRLTILHPLLLKKTEAAIEPPAYTKKKPTTVADGDFRVIEGSSVRFRFELDRPAQTGWLRFVPTGKSTAEASPPIPFTMQGKAMIAAVSGLTKDTDYEIQAEAADGMKLDPQRFHISVQPDRKPEVRLVKPPSAIEVLPTTEVAIHVAASDDFGLKKVGIVFQIGDGPKETLWLDENPQQPVSLTSLATLYLEKHKLTYHDGIVYYAFAEDNYPSGPHRVMSDLQFIDIRAFKREFESAKAGDAKGKDKSPFLELLISKQRTNLQATFRQCRESAVDAKAAKKIGKAERKLTDLTSEFTTKLEQKFGPIPCLEKAIEAMQQATYELDKADANRARPQEEIALAQLIEARRNLRALLLNPKSGSAAEQLDYQAQKNQPERPKDEDEDEDEKKAEDLPKDIADLAKTEQEIADDIDGKSANIANNQQSPSQKEDKSPSKSSQQQSTPSSQSSQSSQSSPSQQSSPGQPQQQSSQPQQSSQTQNGKQPPGLAERQQQAAQKAGEIAQKMQDDSAMTDLAHERIGNAERAIRDSAKSLDRGSRDDAGRQAREAAAQLKHLARQVAGLKAPELASKLKATENIARQLAEQQRKAENSQSQCQGENQGESKSESKQKSKGQGKGEGQEQGEGNGDGQGDADGPRQSADPADRQRAEAEEARTLADLLAESQKGAEQSDADLAHALNEAAEANPPEDIANQIKRAAKALQTGDGDQARREIRQSAERAEALADHLDMVRRDFVQPKLEALLAAEKLASELQRNLSSAVPDQQRDEIEKKLSELREVVSRLSVTDGKLQAETNVLADAIEGGRSGPGQWRQSRQGYFEPPTLYPSAVQRVARALQVRIQELILKDAILDQDQPVPEQYRKQVEDYYRALSEDLR